MKQPPPPLNERMPPFRFVPEYGLRRTDEPEGSPRGRLPFRHYVGRDQSGPWLLRFPQTSLSKEA